MAGPISEELSGIHLDSWRRDLACQPHVPVGQGDRGLRDFRVPAELPADGLRPMTARLSPPLRAHQNRSDSVPNRPSQIDAFRLLLPRVTEESAKLRKFQTRLYP